MGEEVTKYIDAAMFEAEPMKSIVPSVSLLSATPDPLGSIAAACRMYEGKPTYSKKDITDEERVHYWEEVQKTHLKAPLEFVHLHFFLEGVTRGFTHQMVRQRTAVYAQESLRFAVKHNMADEVGYPPSLMGPDTQTQRDKQELWDKALVQIEEAYNKLVAEGVPAEDARGLLPTNVTTRLNYCTNLRGLLDHAGNRLCTQAQFEWRVVILGILKALKNSDSYYEQGGQYGSDQWQWQVITDPQHSAFAPVCYSLGKCPFKAEFDRGCTIRGRVDAGKFEEIDPMEWLADPTAAWVKKETV